MPRKNLIIVGVVFVGLWALAISTGSVIFMGIVGGLTAVLLGLLAWGLRLYGKQKKLNALLQGAVDSPEQRKAALAKLEAGKDANEVVNKFARAQLLAADQPQEALDLLETVEMKQVQPQMQDDFSLLKAQLYLAFGRAKDARPLADRVNLDNTQRAEQRPLMVAVVAEVWARTGKQAEALEILKSVDVDGEANVQLKTSLLAARVFAKFAAGKKGGAKEDLRALSAIDVNQLGRFIAPQFKVHPELVRLARSVAEANPQVRRMAAAQSPMQQRRGRPR